MQLSEDEVCFEYQLSRSQNGHLLLLLGEIDCREGMLKAVR